MDINIIKYLIAVILIAQINASTIIMRFDEDVCNLDPNLVNEISLYQNNVNVITEEIRDGYGQEMYTEYSDFIDQFGARYAGTDNLEDAIDHMINLTYKYGLNDVTTEEVEDVPHWVRGHESAKMIEPYERDLKILGFGSSVSTPLTGIAAEAILINSFEELDAMDEDRIQGKIVVFDAAFKSYGETVKYRVQGASRAAKKGAVATLVKSITPFSIYSPHTGAQYYEANVTKIPTAAITLEDADMLRRIQDRKTNDQRLWLHIRMINSFDLKKSRNTLIDLKGTEKPEKHVIVSGHIDSWDVGTGAMDDGGGMFISWFVPVILNKLKLKTKRTIRSILWTAEEPGLVGAEAYLKRHIKELDNINFIMESDEGTFWPLGLDVAGSNQTRCIIKEILKLFKQTNKMTNSGSPGSDITIFISKGIPGASLLNKNKRYFWFHHSEGDTMNVQSMPNVIECAAFWAAVSYVIADLSIDLPRD